MNFKNLLVALSGLLKYPLEPEDLKQHRRQAYGVIAGGVMEAIRAGEFRHGDESLRLLTNGAEPIRLSKAQLFQDVWVLQELAGKRDGFFVEFGAASGVELSNTWLLEKHYGWTGILAEPNPVFRERLIENRNCILDFECVYTTTGDTVPFRLKSIGELSRILTDAEAKANGKGIIDVPTVTLNDLLTRHNAPRTIDYMSVDTEGSEYDILSAFDFNAWDVRLISVEHNKTAARAALFKLLKSNGYKRVFTELSQFDDWYVKRD